jgi:hypothetical protein
MRQQTLASQSSLEKFGRKGKRELFLFSAPLNTFQRIWPLLVTAEITLSLARLALASTTGVFPFGA